MKKETNNIKNGNELFKNALKNESISRFYANGTHCQLTLADGVIMFHFYDNPICIVSMSVPLMKSLQNNLSLLIKQYEMDCGQVNTIEEIRDKTKVKDEG